MVTSTTLESNKNLAVLVYLFNRTHWGLSLGWVFVCFPVGIVLGLLFDTFLNAMSA